MLQYVTTVKQCIMTICLSNGVWQHIAKKYNRQTVLFPSFNGRLLNKKSMSFALKESRKKAPQTEGRSVAF